MPNKTIRRLNVASIVVKPPGRLDGRLTAAAPAAPIQNRAKGSARIGEARALIENLLLEDDLAHDRLLAGAAADRLNKLLPELSRLEGLQMLFELWIGDG